MQSSYTTREGSKIVIDFKRYLEDQYTESEIDYALFYENDHY